MSATFCGRSAALPSFAVVIVTALLPEPLRADIPCTDVALVLAMDASGSMSDEEFALQMRATAAALLDPGVIDAIRSVGGIALTTLVWSDSAAGIRGVDWDFIHDAPSAARHAARIADLPRGPGGNTDMGQGIAAALDRLADPANCAGRRIINVSGDGRETPQARGRSALSVAAARARAEAEGVAINGLAIEDEDSGLRDWFQTRVITGHGAFAMGVSQLEDYGIAMRKKLIREIRGEALVATVDFAGPYVMPGQPTAAAPPG